MAKRESKIWHPKFIEYNNYIFNHFNYSDLIFEEKKYGELKWVATAKTEKGKNRQRWALDKAHKKGLDEPSIYAKIMLEIHPTKKKICQICGSEMWLLYYYPNEPLIKKIVKKFGEHYSNTDDIFFIVDDLIKKTNILDVRRFLIESFDLKEISTNTDSKKIIDNAELKCRLGESKLLGPGAMSNFPDRFDGFHSYNRCCRAKSDKGRNKENMRTYNKDRRAYEYWSDGNIHAANKIMNSNHFSSKNMSADHIGPISLGFIHDPLNLSPLKSGDNSSKRDRLNISDVEQLEAIENLNDTCMISWYSKMLWLYIKKHYKNHGDNISKFRNGLKHHMNNFMELLWIINNQCGENGKSFLTRKLLQPKMEYFQYEYDFDGNGLIIGKKNRHVTDQTRKEYDRYVRIAFESIYDYHNKINRNIKPNISSYSKNMIDELCKKINNNIDDEHCFKLMTNILEIMQNEIIKEELQ